MSWTCPTSSRRVKPAEITMARNLVAAMTTEFDPAHSTTTNTALP